VENALRRLKDNSGSGGFEGAPSAEAAGSSLGAQVMAMGFINMYINGSAQTKADLAPLAEELLQSFESGRMFRGGGPVR